MVAEDAYRVDVGIGCLAKGRKLSVRPRLIRVERRSQPSDCVGRAVLETWRKGAKDPCMLRLDRLTRRQVAQFDLRADIRGLMFCNRLRLNVDVSQVRHVEIRQFAHDLGRSVRGSILSVAEAYR